jgi:serine protease AprX
MKKIFLILLTVFTAFVNDAMGQQQQPSRFLVKFKNKGNNTFSLSNPSAFLSARSINRRTRYSIPYDSTDLPVTIAYIDSLKAIPTVLVLNASKWLNQVSVKITDTTAANIAYVQNRINSLPFVLSYIPIAMKAGVDKNALPADPAAERMARIAADYYNYGPAANQIKIHNGEFLHNIGLRGNNMIVGMLDAGYKNYLTVRSLDSARANGQILGTYDFVANDTSVNEDHQHGMQCLSIIAANVPGEFVGSAPKSSFYLFKTEDVASETPIEEHNWVCGAERVDSAGGDVISSSLGYNTFDAPFTSHTYAELTGDITMPAIGADFAAKKGILVVNAAGNEGGNAWGKIITPADADSALAVGAVTSTGIAATFTSRGPTADGRRKPDVVSMGVGTILQFPNNTIGPGNGTSFACPNMAGLATCLWQGFPEVNNMRIIDVLRKAGSRANNPNDTIGYGIPDMKKAFLSLVHDFSTANATISNCKTNISWTSKDVSAMRYEIERSVSGQPYTKVFDRPGTGSVFGEHAYTYSDTLINIAAGSLSYRIKQVIDTSVAGLSAGYIDTLTVNLATSCSTTAINPINPYDNLVILQPNPTRGKVTLKITTETSIKDLRIQVADASGRITASYKRNKSAGTSLIEIPSGNFARGEYFIRVYNGNKLMATKKLVKL